MILQPKELTPVSKMYIAMRNLREEVNHELIAHEAYPDIMAQKKIDKQMCGENLKIIDAAILYFETECMKAGYDLPRFAAEE